MGTRGQRQLLASSSFNLGVQRYLLIRHELLTLQYGHTSAKTHARTWPHRTGARSQARRARSNSTPCVRRPMSSPSTFRHVPNKTVSAVSSPSFSLVDVNDKRLVADLVMPGGFAALLLPFTFHFAFFNSTPLSSKAPTTCSSLLSLLSSRSLCPRLPLRSMLFRPRPPRQPRPSSGRSRPLPTSKASSTLISSVRTFTKRLRNTDSRPLEAMLLRL
jgi:hypothetical protein